MSSTPEQRRATVDAAIREISHIATLPEITVKIIELVEDPKSTAQDLHAVISQDPALCSRILKVVNSSFYGLPGQIASINRAIVMLGLNAVKNIAIAASLVKLFRGGELAGGFSAKQIWDQSTATAAACKMISDRLKLGLNDEAYLAGLVHNIGIVVEMQFDRSKLIDVIHRIGLDSSGVPAIDMIQVENEVFGASHQDFGLALCEKWKFPKSFANVTGHHHSPWDLSADSRTLTNVVYVADRVVGSSVTGSFRPDLVSLTLDQRVLDDLKLTLEGFGALRDQYDAAAKSAMDMAA
ncbi:MAG: HDOD domain-containing protein [Phycisphaeraceae bacterium]|nr:HDOD domain-containing protein [Phycisphaeraceae bacterium]